MVELPNNEDFAPRLSFSVERSLVAYVEPDDYVLTVHGSICTDDATEIGRLLGYIIRVNRAINDEQDLFEACDAHSQTATDYYEALFDHKTGDFKESIEEQLSIMCVGNILILDRIEVLPAYRKHGVGLAAGCCFIDTCSNDVDDLAVGLPHPLQFSTEGRRSDAEWDMKMNYQDLHAIGKRRRKNFRLIGPSSGCKGLNTWKSTALPFTVCRLVTSGRHWLI